MKRISTPHPDPRALLFKTSEMEEAWELHVGRDMCQYLLAKHAMQ